MKKGWSKGNVQFSETWMPNRGIGLPTLTKRSSKSFKKITDGKNDLSQVLKITLRMKFIGTTV